MEVNIFIPRKMKIKIKRLENYLFFATLQMFEMLNAYC